jgi:Fe-S cluster biogenesis protein NfuA
MSTPDPSLRDKVSQVLAAEVLPLLAMDGTSVEVLDVIGGVVRLRLRGACAGCPGSVYAAVMGIEQELRRRVPGVEYLEAVP